MDNPHLDVPMLPHRRSSQHARQQGWRYGRTATATATGPQQPLWPVAGMLLNKAVYSPPTWGVPVPQLVTG